MRMKKTIALACILLLCASCSAVIAKSAKSSKSSKTEKASKHEKAAEKSASADSAESGDGEQKTAKSWTEKQRIGDDVPMEAWRDISVTPWAAALCLHGLSLHAKNYADFGKRLGHLGIPTYAIDVRGFGSWQNTGVGQSVDFQSTFSDVENALQSIHKAHPGLPVVLIGESMGGGLALQAAAKYPKLVDGLICSVPSRKHSGQKSTSLKVAIGMVTSPNKDMKVGKGVVERATSNADVAMDWESDPLARMNISPKDLLRYSRLMKQNDEAAEQLSNTPTLFLQGGNDRLIKPAGTLELFSKLKTTDKDLVMVGSAEHLIFEQGQFTDDVVDLITNWIDKHIVAPQLEKSASSTIKTGREAAANKDLDRSREALGHFRIADGYLMLNDYANASTHLLDTIHLAKGSALAARADRMLLKFPENVIAPKTGETTVSTYKLVELQAAKANSKPSILVFTAPWMESCSTVVESVRTALGSDGDKINLVVIDADEPKNAQILSEYGVKPLPAILYLNGANQVILYTLGDPGVAAIKTRIGELQGLEKRTTNP